MIRYYYSKSGAKTVSWIKDKSEWYYLESERKMKTGWI